RPGERRHPLLQPRELGHQAIELLLLKESLVLQLAGEAAVEFADEAVGWREEEIEDPVEGLSIPGPLDERGGKRGMDGGSVLQADRLQGDASVLDLGRRDPHAALPKQFGELHQPRFQAHQRSIGLISGATRKRASVIRRTSSTVTSGASSLSKSPSSTTSKRA